MRDRSGAGLLPVGWPCSAFMTWAANLHRWRLSSSFSPLSPLWTVSRSAGDRVRMLGGEWRAGIGGGSLRRLALRSGAGDDLRAAPASLAVSAAGLACSAPLLFSFAPAALLLSVRPAALCCRCSAELLRRAGAVSGSAVLPVLGALVLSQGARAGAVRFVILHNSRRCISSIFSLICQVSNA